MNIDRHELIKEIILREQIQKIIKNYTNETLKTTLQEQKLRMFVRNLIPQMLREDAAQTKEEVAIALVRDTLLAVVKIIKSDQGKFRDPEVQDGFIKYCMLALHNDFEENHGEEGELEIDYEEPAETEMAQPPVKTEEGEDLVLEEFQNDGDENLDIKIKASDHEMFIPDEKEEEEEEKTDFEAQEGELFLTLTDAEKVGFRYAKETTWSKVTKQIKRIHKMAIPDPEIVNTYEKWLTKNIELHGQNTKEETAFEGGEAEAEAETEAGGESEAEFEL